MLLSPTPQIVLGALLLAGATHAQSEHTLVETTNRTGDCPGVGSFPIDQVWKLGCAGDNSAVDRATFLQAVEDSKAISAANAHNGSLVPLPQSTQSALGSFDLAFTLAGTPPPLTAAVAELETYFEARLGSVHASGSIPITIQWGPLPAGVLMSTATAYGTLSYTDVRANMVQHADTTDTLPQFLPAGPTYPVRFDGTTSTVTNVTDVYCAAPWLQATFPNVVIGPGPYATITISSAYGWDFDPTNGTSPAGFCIKSALAHEIVHALGFASDIDLLHGTPTQLDLLRFQNSVNHPANSDYLAFGTQARLVDFNTPDNDAQLNLGSFSYRMEDGSPYQASHFLQTTPMIGVMQPALAPGETYWPDYLRTGDLRVLDALGYDWLDQGLVGLARIQGMAIVDENPNSSTSVRYKATFTRRVTGVSTGDFDAGGFMSTGVTSVVPVKGKAAHFDGTNWFDLQNHAPITSTGTRKFAIDCWIRPAVQPASGASRRDIFSAGGGGAAAGDSVWLYLDSNSRLRFDTTGDAYAPALPVLNDGNWHHITINSCCGTNATVQVLVDFVNFGTDTMSFDIQPGSAMIGRSLSNGASVEGFIGAIDEFRFYNNTLVPNATQAMTPLGAFQDSLLLVCIPFDTLSGQTTLIETLTGGTAVGGTTSGTYPSAVPGIVDSAEEFVVTFATTLNSGLLFGEFIDDNTVREMRSGAAHNGPDAGIDWSFAPYTMQHQSGESFCEGTACPCANDATQGTWVGCLSSLGQGGRLRASGSPSIASASLTLLGTQMPNATALYFAGNAQTSNLVGDGLFCVGGTILRLGSKLNAAGASQFPDVGQASIAERVSATPGMTSYFQAWYRNAASFCTPATFNETNAWRLTWAP